MNLVIIKDRKAAILKTTVKRYHLPSKYEQPLATFFSAVYSKYLSHGDHVKLPKVSKKKFGFNIVCYVSVYSCPLITHQYPNPLTNILSYSPIS